MGSESTKLTCQRVRNRIIELLDSYSSLEKIASQGAFEMINRVDDSFPIDYEKARGVFSESERQAIAKFSELAAKAADVTNEDTWDVDWFRVSQEWVSASAYAKLALVIFSKRGCFPEQHEEGLPD